MVACLIPSSTVRQVWQTATESNLLKTSNTGRTKFVRSDWDLKSPLRCLGYLGYALLRFTRQLNE